MAAAMIASDPKYHQHALILASRQLIMVELPVMLEGWCGVRNM